MKRLRILLALLLCGCATDPGHRNEDTAVTPPPPADSSWEEVAKLPDCPRPECTGPRLGMPNWECTGGHRGGPACKRLPNGTCGWAVIRCPRAEGSR